ncbi:uncharacterized protein SCHCODRAFT_01105670 [Schizophyllum commune H4-8]|nr:uncharacterized protein SCHCODRAFT_01105670 [Schizophyllum commune H4-8]KAI5886762.1 hypothetical protein SCHCODRAFT_01105670 [Schizophyllum commune H4-8]
MAALSTTLKSDFKAKLEAQSHTDALARVNIAAKPPPDAFEKSLSEDDARAYSISRSVPNYVDIRFIQEYIWDNRPFRWALSVNNADLLLPLPKDAPLAPRGTPHGGGVAPRAKGHPPMNGSCSRQITVGVSPILKAFTDALAADKVNIFRCAAQTTVRMEPGREYGFDDLFDAAAYPFSKIGECCGGHYRQVQRELRLARGSITHYIGLKRSTVPVPRPALKAVVKSAARTRPKKRVEAAASRAASPAWGGGSSGAPSSSSAAGPSTSTGAGPSSLRLGVGLLSSFAGVGDDKDDPIYISSGSESSSDGSYSDSEGSVTMDDVDGDSDSDSLMSHGPRLGSPFVYKYQLPAVNMSDSTRSSHKRKAPPRPSLHRSQPHQGTHIEISADKRRILKTSHRFSTSSTFVPHEPPLPPPRLVEPDERPSNAQDDPFFQAYNENEGENVIIARKVDTVGSRGSSPGRSIASSLLGAAPSEQSRQRRADENSSRSATSPVPSSDSSAFEVQGHLLRSDESVHSLSLYSPEPLAVSPRSISLSPSRAERPSMTRTALEGGSTPGPSQGPNPPDEEADEGRRSESDEENTASNETNSRRLALTAAGDLMYNIDRSKPEHLRSVRKRLDSLIKETRLTPERVVDRGIARNSTKTRFTLHAEFLAFIEDVVGDVDNVLSTLYPATTEAYGAGTECYEVDPGGVLLEALKGSKSLAALNVAWSLFNSRCVTAARKHRKYKALVEAHIEKRAPNAMLSPLTTPRSVYSDMNHLEDNETKLKYLLGSAPSATDVLRPSDAQHRTAGRVPRPPREERLRFVGQDLRFVAPPPSPLIRAFPEREAEDMPRLVYYENGLRKERAPSTTFNNPDPLTPEEQAQYVQLEKKKKRAGFKQPPQPEEDPTAPVGRGLDTRLPDIREGVDPRLVAPAPPISAFGMLSTGTRLQPSSAYYSAYPGDSASNAGTPRHYNYPEPVDRQDAPNSSSEAYLGAATSISAHPHLQVQHPSVARVDPPRPNHGGYAWTATGGGGGGDGDPPDPDDGGPPPPNPPPGFPRRLPVPPPVPPPRKPARAGGGGGGPPGGGGGPSASYPDASGGPRPPYASATPTIQANLKMDCIPSWDGNRDTISPYLWAFFELANSGGSMRAAVAHWAWMRFPAGSSIYNWYLTLSEDTKEYMKKDAYNFMDVIKQQYLGAQWMKDMAVGFQLQSFREPKHRHETPSDFVNRRILDARSLGFAERNSVEEVKLVLSVAPADWDAKLIPSTLGSTDELKARVIQHERSLSMTSASVNQEVRAQVLSALKEYGRFSGDSRRRTNLMRGPVAYEAEAGIDPEELEDGERHNGGAEANSDDPANELYDVAFNVVASKEKNKSSASYPFPTRDSIVSRKPPPSPCRACGSKKHWNKDCPFWQQYLSRYRESLLAEGDPDTERAYNAAYAVMKQGFDGAASQLDQEHESSERKTQKEEADGPVTYEVRQPQFALTVEEIGEEYWYRGEMLPADYPHILEHVDAKEQEEDEAPRMGAVAERQAPPEPEVLVAEEAPRPTDRPPDEHPQPKPYEPPKIKLLAKKRVRQELRERGMTVLCVRGRLCSEIEKELLLRMDSCASLSLLAGWLYDSLKNPPPLRQGAKMKLWQLTDKSVNIRGYVCLPVLIRADDGTLIEAEAELYVVDGMTVPILLGEDFQQAYEISVERDLEQGTTLTFGEHPAPISAEGAPRSTDYDKVERAYVGEKPVHGWLKKAHRQHLKSARRERRRHTQDQDSVLRAQQDIRLKPETVVNIPVSGPFDKRREWIVERELLAAGEQKPFAIPNTLISSDKPVVPIANLATTPRKIRRGEIVAKVMPAEEFFDKPASAEHLAELANRAAFMSNHCQHPPSPGEEEDAPVPSTVPPPAQPGAGRASPVPHRFRMPEAVNYEAWKERRRSFPMPDAETYTAWKESFQSQVEKENEPAADVEQCGPKTAEVPDAEGVSSSDFRRVLDVGALPVHLKDRAWAMLERR